MEHVVKVLKRPFCVLDFEHLEYKYHVNSDSIIGETSKKALVATIGVVLIYLQYLFNEQLRKNIQQSILVNTIRSKLIT